MNVTTKPAAVTTGLNAFTSPAAARDRTREIVRTRRTGDDRRQAGRPSDPTEGTFSPLSATASSAGSSRSAGRIPDASASRSPSAR